MQTCPHHYCLSILEGIDFRVHLAGCVLTLPKRCKLACNVGEQQYQKNSKETKEPNPKPQATPTIWFYSYVRLFGNDSPLPTIIPTTIPTNGTVECNRKLPLNEGSVASPRTLLPFCRSLADASGKAIAHAFLFWDLASRDVWLKQRPWTWNLVITISSEFSPKLEFGKIIQSPLSASTQQNCHMFYCDSIQATCRVREPLESHWGAHLLFFLGIK